MAHTQDTVTTMATGRRQACGVGCKLVTHPGVVGRVVGAPSFGSCADNEGWRDTLTRLTFIGADGTEYELIDVLHNGIALESYYNSTAVSATTLRAVRCL